MQICLLETGGREKRKLGQSVAKVRHGASLALRINDA